MAVTNNRPIDRVRTGTTADTTTQPTSAAAPKAGAATPTAKFHEDGVDVPSGASEVVASADSALAVELAAVKKRVGQLEAEAAKEKKKPGFLRVLMELFDLLMKLNPVYNMICAGVRLINHFFLGKEMDWKRLGLDIIGIGALWAPWMGMAAMAGHATLNVMNRESDIAGGVNRHFETNSTKKESMFNPTFDMLGDLYDGAVNLVSGKSRAPEAKPETDAPRDGIYIAKAAPEF